jgi:hypothetical protein
MLKRLSLMVGLIAALGAFGGCRFVAPVAESVGGCPPGSSASMGQKNKAIMRQWGRDLRKGERFVDQYFLNYDINDPYRGDCLTGY